MAGSMVNSAPRMSAEDAFRIGQELFNLWPSSTTSEPDKVSMLDSERDQNFRLVAEDGNKYVLKISNAQEEYDVLDLQNKALVHLATKCDVPVARLVPTRDGQLIATITGSNGASHLVRLLTYLPGKLMGECNPQTNDLLHNLGQYLGKLDKALSEFDHPAADRVLQWDLKQAPAVIRLHKDKISDPARRRIVERMLSYFDEHVAPLLPTLRTSIIHADANDYNILVDDGASGGGVDCARVVTGIIDYGDMLRTYTVCELAIAAAYAMLPPGRRADPVAAAAAAAAGYHSEHPLAAAELECLYPLACIRLCTSVCLSAHQRALQPDNAYLSISEGPAWGVLEALANYPPPLACYRIRAACSLIPCPREETVRDYISEHPGLFGPVIDADLTKAGAVVVLDQSVGSALAAAAGGLPVDPAAAGRAVREEIGRAGATVGLSRHGEASLTRPPFRPISAAPASIGEGDTAAAAAAAAAAVFQRPTVCLGCDIFVEPAAPVYAPLSGTVHAVGGGGNGDGGAGRGAWVVLEHSLGAAGPLYTLLGRLDPSSLGGGGGLAVGARVDKGGPVGRVAGPQDNGGWTAHVHVRLMLDTLDELGPATEACVAEEKAVWLSICPDPSRILGVPAAAFPPPPRDKAALLSSRRRLISSCVSISYSDPLHIVRAHRQHLYDSEGRGYLDGVNNVCHVGHCHPDVVRAVQLQMGLLNTNTRYIYEGLTDYAELLTSKLPEPLRVCFFVNSGSEANDLALRLARAAANAPTSAAASTASAPSGGGARRHVICLGSAYHGHTEALIGISPYKFDGAGGAGRPSETHVAPAPDVYRGPYASSPDPAQAYADTVRDIIHDVHASGGGVAAFIAESIISCGGQIILPRGYLAKVYEYVRAAGGVCIADEVQVGFGRAGTHMWAFETQGVVPDIVTLGKPTGNGHPIGVVVTTAAVAAAFANGMEYFNTFGGNPVSCAAGIAVLEVVEREGLQAHALRVGSRLVEGLRGLMDRHQIIGDVRGLGLFIGVEMVLNRQLKTPAAAHASHAVNRLRDEGILVSTDGPDHNVLKLKPPMAFDDRDAARLVAALDRILAEDAFRLRPPAAPAAAAR